MTTRQHHRRRNAGTAPAAADALSRVLSAFFAVVLAVGVCLVAYPTVSDWWNRMHQSRAVASYIEQTEDLSAVQRQTMLDAAQAYNRRLAQRDGRGRWTMTDAERAEYDSLLDVSGTGVMGYVTIPRIAVRLPIYHGTDEGVLQIAVGHLAGSSLPVGGADTHAVVSGHTGLPSAKLLTGLDRLREGDTFAFHVLGETLTYQVDRIDVVLPDELDRLGIEPGRDYATLVTCTPYGVNSHRLLVRGHRIPTPAEPDDVDYAAPVALMGLAIGAGAGALLAAAAVAAWRLTRRRPRCRGAHISGAHITQEHHMHEER